MTIDVFFPVFFHAVTQWSEKLFIFLDLVVENRIFKYSQQKIACKIMTKRKSMLITLYKSSLCPRCHLAKKYLKQIAQGDPSISIKEVDVLLSPRKALREGARMIPAIKIDGEIRGALYFKKSAIKKFIDRHRP